MQISLDYRKIFESAPDNYLVLSPELEILDASDHYLAVSRTKREEIVGRQLFDVFPDNPQDALATGERNLAASLERVKETLKPDTMAVQKYDIPPERDSNGQVFEAHWWSPVNTPVLNARNELEYIIHQVVEVTAFVQTSAAQAVTTRESQLRAEILQRSAALGESNEALRVAAEAKNTFLARMSHELRTPLTAINGFSELLSLADMTPEQKVWVNTIRRSGAHLLELIDEVLDISRIESGQFSISIESVPLERLLAEAIEIMRPLADSTEVALERVVSMKNVYVKADGQRLRQVLINLISNAIKYNKPGGRVTIRASATDEMAMVEVADTGFGIAEKDLEKLFQPFERLGATATEVQGTGLGLSLSRNLIELLDGTIEVTSEIGQGTTFTVNLPIAETAAVESAEPDATTVLDIHEYDRDVKLLYVEDTAENVRLVEEILKRRPSVHMLPAMFGRLAIELADKHRPDIVLLDLHLPDIGGNEVLRHFAGRPELNEIPVIVLSADATKTQLERLKYLGAKDYLTKPIGVEKLLATVDRWIEGPPAGANK